MKPPLRIADVERITLRVPFTPRVQRWNALLVWQWQIVEIIRVTTDDGTVGYGETLPHYTWGRVPEDGPQRVMGRNGHLSNAHTCDYLESDLDSEVQTLILGHLSEHNNHPAIVRMGAEQSLMKRNMAPNLVIVIAMV